MRRSHPTIRTIARIGSVLLLGSALFGSGLLANATAQTSAQNSDDTASRLLDRAIAAGIEGLRAGVDNYPKHRECFSCHHQALPILVLRDASREDENRLMRIRDFTLRSFRVELDAMQAGEEVGGRGLTLGYGLWSLSLADSPREDTIDSMIENALRTQREDGRWRIHSHRPPAATSDAIATALVVHGLNHYRVNHPEADRILAALQKASSWLAVQPNPDSTEDACGLLWLENALRRSVKEASTAPIDANWLWNQQQSDGGWSQSPGRESDAYSTGMTLHVLSQYVQSQYSSDNDGRTASKIESWREDPRVQRGIAFLLQTQCSDGSWHVSSRVVPVQEYFDNGDPHETDQFISIMATAWATSALQRAVDASNRFPR